MSIQPVSKPSTSNALDSTSHVKWDELDFGECKYSANEGQFILRGTYLSCPLSSEAGQWKNRKIFIETVVADVIAHCPRDEPLVLISLGSDLLLNEYIIGKTLIENGFRGISFLLVDPSYVFSGPNAKQVIQKVLQNFREKIEISYLKEYKAHFPRENIRYLSRSQKISKHFPSHANVVMIESLPPYAEIIEGMKKNHMQEKKPEDLLAGSQLVSSSDANCVIFLPKRYAEQLNITPNLNPLPLRLLESRKKSSFYYIDWGCKIHSDGTHHLSFSGEGDYFESLGHSKKTKTQLPTGEVVNVERWASKVEDAIERTISDQIKVIKNGDSQEQLTQAHLTALLEKIKEVFMRYLPGAICVFSVDYMVDRSEALNFLSSHAGHHYRRVFSLKADASRGYRITIDKI